MLADFYRSTAYATKIPPTKKKISTAKSPAYTIKKKGFRPELIYIEDAILTLPLTE